MPPKTLPDLFVDRDRQIEVFRRIIGGQTSRRIMILSAGAGLGKSWLVRTFAAEARKAALPLAQIDFYDGQAYDALALVRRFRDAFGAEHFNTLNQAINDATTIRVVLAAEQPAVAPSVNVNIGDNNVLTNSDINITNAGTVIRDNNLVIETDNPLIRQVAEDRITLAFFRDLTLFSAAKRVVFLFDTYERTSQEADRWVPNAADRWITTELLARIRDGKLPNVVVVLAGRRAPDFGIEWNEVLGRLSLEPLECEFVTEYLRVRRGLTQITDAEAERLCQATGGSPQVLGIIGDNLERANAPATQDDDW